MESEVQSQKQVAPLLPRRSVFAAFLSSVLAAAVVALVTFGGIDRVEEETFQFSRNLTLQQDSELRLRGFLSKALHDKRMFVTIVGHSGGSGDPAANIALSEERAAFAAAVAEEVGIDLERIAYVGVGASDPLPKLEGESERVYQSRLARVDISMQVRR